MKVKAIKNAQGLKKDQEYDITEMSAKYLIDNGIATESVEHDNDTEHTANSGAVKPKRSKAASKSR